MDNALSGYISINESADSSNGLFTEEEQEDRETDIRMLPTLTSKLKDNNILFSLGSPFIYRSKVANSAKEV